MQRVHRRVVLGDLFAPPCGEGPTGGPSPPLLEGLIVPVGLTTGFTPCREVPVKHRYMTDKPGGCCGERVLHDAPVSQMAPVSPQPVHYRAVTSIPL